jgi:hypothetical protein
LDATAGKSDDAHKKHLTGGGDVSYGERTNTLIIVD